MNRDSVKLETVEANDLYRTLNAGDPLLLLDGHLMDEFPAGSFLVDMAQPMANAAFYYLEPQTRDGFVGWHVMDHVLRDRDVAAGPAVYPVFKARRLP